MVNEWTRNDLPDATELCRMSVYNIDVMVERNLNAIVDHLNANHPKPETGLLSGAADCVLESAERVKVARADADRWRRAHEIVEGERDLARERLREVDSALAKCMSDYQDVEDERDEAREQSRAASIGWMNAADSAEAADRDRDEWKARAEAAEAACEGFKEYIARFCKPNPAPAVTREDIEKAIRPKFEQWQSQLAAPVDRATDAVWSLVSGADPVEELAGQIEAATRTAIRQVCDDLATVAPSLDPLTVERAMEVTAASRKVAAHVLGQEASDE